MLDDSGLAMSIGDWSIDPSLNRLDREGTRVFVRPRVMDLLVYLHARPGEVVGLNEIMEAIWKDTIVTTGSVYGCINELRDALGDRKDAPSYIETIPKRGYRLIADTGATQEVIAIETNSLAVLPFENLSPDPDDAYFADGIHEELLTQLGKIRDLAVIARTSVLTYANTNKPVPEIASELNVRTVMEGSVRYAGNRVRINAQLIDGRTGTHLWSEAYDRDLSDIFAVQLDIAMKITDAMKAEFSVAEQESISKPPTDNLEAYAYYLRALSREHYMRSIELNHEELDGALALDPEFALALATKAWFYSNQISAPLEGVDITPESQRRYARLTRLFAERALAIDPNLSWAYSALAFVYSYNLHWAESVANMDLAYQVDPDRPWVLMSYALDLALRGRLEEAVPLVQRFFLLDPANWGTTVYGAEIMGGCGPIDLAIDYAQRVVSLAPELHYGYTKLARLLAMSGDAAAALKAARRSETLLAVQPYKVAILDLMEAYYWMGREDDVLRLFRQLQALGGSQTISDGDLFRAYFSLGDFDAALDHLDTAIEAHFPAGFGQAVGNILVTRYYEPLWGHPRFEAAVEKVGLEAVYKRPIPLLG